MTDKATKATSVRGVFSWPKLDKPDDKYNKYSCNLIVDADGLEAMSEILKAPFDAAVEAGREADAERKTAARKKNPFSVNDWFTPVYDEDTEEETGNFIIKFSATGSGTKKDGTPWKRGPIPCFDGLGNPFKAPEKIWSGSEGKVSFTYRPYFIAGTGVAGLSLQLSAVQVLELNSGGGGTADSHGFGVEDDGFDGSSITSSAETEESDDTEGVDADAASDF